MATWREYRESLATLAPPPPKKPRTPDGAAGAAAASPRPDADVDVADAVSPEHLAEAFAPEADRHGYGDAAEALSAVQAALDHPSGACAGNHRLRDACGFGR